MLSAAAAHAVRHTARDASIAGALYMVVVK